MQIIMIMIMIIIMIIIIIIISLCTTNSGGVMLVRTQKNDESRLIDFLSSAPAGWNPTSDQVMIPVIR